LELEALIEVEGGLENGTLVDVLLNDAEADVGRPFELGPKWLDRWIEDEF
jgi:hypothetical protein